MPTIIQRRPLPIARLGLAFGLYALGIATPATPGTSPTDQSDVMKGPPLSEVTVIGKMDKHTLKHVVNQFIQSHAQPSAIIGQIGRWHENVCPAVSGLKAVYGEFVSRRIISAARNAGAPVQIVGKKCTTNVEVIFASRPQALLDHFAKKYRPLLGYYPIAQAKQAITFSHPVQAWYVTGSRSVDGYHPPANFGGLSHTMPSESRTSPPPPIATSPFVTGPTIDSDETAGDSGEGMGPTGTAGSYLTRGLRSDFLHVLIIVDSRALAKYSLQTVSDYIALLALTHIASLDSCSQLPSILNLFAKDCPSPPSVMTASDTAYLKSLYKANLEANLGIEQGDIRVHMVTAISKK